MNPIVLTMPDEHRELAGWLERQLAGMELPRLVAELLVVHGSENKRTTLPRDLDVYLDSILQSGLSGLPDKVLCQLLQNPKLLLDLQEKVLIEGGPYWDNLLARADGMNEHVETSRAYVEALVRRDRGRAWPGVVLALAASVFLVVGVWWQLQLNRPGTDDLWGWSRPDVLREDRTAQEYLTGLADAANEWFDKPPQSAEALDRRLTQMIQGCSRLIQAEHSPLVKADRVWLIASCKKWAVKLDNHLAELKSGKKDLAAVQQDADKTIHQLVEALRARARQVG